MHSCLKEIKRRLKILQGQLNIFDLEGIQPKKKKKKNKQNKKKKKKLLSHNSINCECQNHKTEIVLAYKTINCEWRNKTKQKKK